MRRVALAVLLALSVAPPSVARADWEVTRSPFDPRLVARYKQALKANPDDSATLKRLWALYKSYRTTAELVREYAGARDVADLLVLGHLEALRGDDKQAIEAYRRAHEAAPDDVRPALALAEALQRTGDAKGARTQYQAALPKLSGPKRRAVWKALAELALRADVGLDAKAALAEARGYYRQLLDENPGDEDTRRELAEALATHGDPKGAATEWRALVERLGRDPARQTRALLRAGDLEVDAGDDAAAIEAYRRARKLSPKGSYLERESLDKLIAAYRHKDELRTIVAELEREGGHGFVELEALARLHDELGATARAEEVYRKALAVDPHAIEARRRLIALLEREGKDGDVLAEYRRLIAAAPGEPRFRLELAERLWRASPPDGDGRKEALELARRLGQETRDPSVHGALAELYTRWGQNERALAEREALVRLEPNEESHLVNLGELYFQRGRPADRARAIEVWKRLLNAPGKREQQMARLAEVYAEHDLPGEALDLYQKAVKLKPDDPTLQKGLAGALERMHRDDEAEAAWQAALEQAVAKRDRALVAEIRPRAIGMALRTGRLAARVGLWANRFGAAGDDATVSAWGLSAVEGALKLGRTSEALTLLERLQVRASSNELKADACVARAQVLKARHDAKGAIAALEEAARLNPQRARELYAQIAELSLSLYQDADALTYAKKAVELGPADANAQLRLAEIQEKREQLDAAAEAYQRVLQLDERAWKAYVALARLQLRRGQPAEAARLYRQLIRRAPDEDLVLEAVRRAADLDEYLGTLGELERDLAPLADAHPDKPIYRTLLVDVIDRYAAPLIPRARSGDQEARQALERLGQHALKPLLEVLVSDDAELQQQRRAVALLGELGNPSAAEPLLRLASPRAADKKRPEARRALSPAARAAIELRVDAALAGARLAGVRELPTLLQLAQDPEKYLRIAALSGLPRAGGAQAEKALEHALADSSPELVSLAAVGVARMNDVRAVAELTRLVRDRAQKDEARTAAAWALGALAPKLPEAQAHAARAALVEALRDGGDDLAAKSAWALGRLGPQRSLAALYGAVFSRRSDVRQAAVAALATPAAHETVAVADLARAGDTPEVRGWVRALPIARADRAALDALLTDGDALARALSDALFRHRDVALRALADLDAPAGAVGPLAVPAGARAELVARLSAALDRLRHDADAGVRARAVRVEAQLRDGAGRALAALSDPAEEVRVAALEVLSARALADADTAREVRRALDGKPVPAGWRERRAAVALLAEAFDGSAPLPAAVAAALDDRSGFVREAAARALGRACEAQKGHAAHAVTAAPLLAAHALDDVAEVRAAVAAALGACGRPPTH